MSRSGSVGATTADAGAIEGARPPGRDAVADDGGVAEGSEVPGSGAGDSHGDDDATGRAGDDKVSSDTVPNEARDGDDRDAASRDLRLASSATGPADGVVAAVVVVTGTGSSVGPSGRGVTDGVADESEAHVESTDRGTNHIGPDEGDEICANPTGSDVTEAASDGTVSDGTGSDGTGSDGAASDGVGSDGTVSDGTGSDGTGSDEAASDEAASDEAASDETASDETASDETASDGTGSDEAACDRTVSDRAESDGRGSGRARPDRQESDRLEFGAAESEGASVTDAEGTGPDVASGELVRVGRGLPSGRALSPVPRSEPGLRLCRNGAVRDEVKGGDAARGQATRDERARGEVSRVTSSGRVRCAGGSGARRRGVVVGRALGEVEVSEGPVRRGVARTFVERALRFLLEVLDRRRPAAQLSTVADVRVVASVRTLVGSGLVPGGRLGVATLGRVTVVPVDERAAEVHAGYDRGARHFALAARFARVEADKWRIVALRVR